MEPDDFRAIEAWLADAAFIPPKKQPQPHQTEALDALLPALDSQDRVSAIMACGTGKTLIALWIAERRRASRILILVPSLALRQAITTNVIDVLSDCWVERFGEGISPTKNSGSSWRFGARFIQLTSRMLNCDAIRYTQPKLSGLRISAGFHRPIDSHLRGLGPRPGRNRLGAAVTPFSPAAPRHPPAASQCERA